MRFGGLLRAGSIPSVSQMQNSSQDADDAPSCPLSKFITTEASQGGVIAHTTIKFTRQHDIVSFSLAPACRQILWSDDPWTGREIEPAWENYFESQGYKLTETCKECGFTKLYVLCRFYLLRFRPFPRPRRHRGAALNVSRQKLRSSTRTAA